MSADSDAAHKLVELINADPGLKPKINVVVVSEQNGVVFRDHLPRDPLAEARTVVIWDQGGHFEALEPLRINSTRRA
jgi:hypothetical protein